MPLRNLVLCSALVLCACASSDTGVGVTSNRDYTLKVSVLAEFVRVGDTVPVYVQLRRTDSSNLPPGLRGNIVLTTTANGVLSAETVPVNVGNVTTEDVSDNLTFRGVSSGPAEVRATFRDATASVRVVISEARTP